MYMHPVPHNKAARKQGIALIVVLALLAMLVIMSVSFVVFMRTERTSSRDYAEFVKARNLAQAGITRALVRMQQDMNTTNNAFYHGGYIFTAIGTDHCTDWLNNTNDVNYVPANYVGKLTAARSAGGPVFWNNLVVTNIGSTVGKIAGRYAYMVFDCSDFLDVNAITNRLRGAGNDPGEVALPAGVLYPLVSLRTTEHPFESLNELTLRNMGVAPPNVVTYSYAPVDSYLSNNTTVNQTLARLYISTNAATIRTQVGNIKAATARLGFDPAFADNLVDFVDTSTDVRYDNNFARMGGGKLVPMLYQIAATNGMRRTVVAGKNRWEVETRVFYETWYPFPVTAGKTYHVQLSAVPQASVPTPAAPGFAWAPCTVSNGWQTTPTTVTPTAPTIQTSLPFYTNSFWTNAYVIVYTNGFTGTLVSASTTLTLPSVVSVMNSGGQTVDKPTLNSAIYVPTAFPLAAVGASVPPILQYGVVDPRINYRITDWRHNVVPTLNTIPTLLGRTNEFCDVFGQKYDKDLDQCGDGSTFMYARRPAGGTTAADPAGLYGLGDFGYLLYSPDKPWHTVRLTTPRLPCADRSSQVFNLLAIQTNNVRGFVNPNSQCTNALSCAFLGASRAKYYGEVGAPAALTVAQATALATTLINRGVKLGLPYAYTNIADVCRLFSGFNAYNAAGVVTGDIFAVTGDADLWRQKAVMGSSIGLMNPRQNYWLVLVCAQAVKQVTNPLPATPILNTDYFVTAEVQCLAYIWRDPYEDPRDTLAATPPGVHPVGQGRHKMFVQFFKWL
jgi:hypothetical protein